MYIYLLTNNTMEEENGVLREETCCLIAKTSRNQG